jgi:transcriptional regulator with XRE-family HTH domain
VRRDHRRPNRQTLSRLDVGALVREARRHAGLTQAELAARLGTKQPVVSRWERGVDTPRFDTLARLLQECGFEADLVFRRHDDDDRTLIASMLDDLTPEQRLRSNSASALFVAQVRHENRTAASV